MIVGTKPRKRSEKPCEQCGKVFYPIWGEAAKYCSKGCVGLSQIAKRPINCRTCGSEYLAHLSEPNREYCSRACWIEGQYVRPLDRTHNGKPAVIDNMGYVRIYEPGHPRATKSGWVFEHRVVVEQLIGRYLARDEQVHHINHIRHDNRIENLTRMSHSEHSRITGSENASALRDAIALRQRLHEYETRFGPLPIAQ